MAKSENTKVEKKKSERQKTDTKASLIKTKNIIKEIVVPGKLVNIVAK